MAIANWYKLWDYTSLSGDPNPYAIILTGEKCMAMSRDGSRLIMVPYWRKVAGSYNYKPMFSTNDGGSFTDATTYPNNQYFFSTDVCVSSTGQYAMCCRVNSNDRIIQTADSGVTWAYAPSSLPAYQYYGVAMSGNGQYRIAVRYAGTNVKPYRSVDFGANWAEISGFPTGWNYMRGAAISDDGQTIYIGGLNGRMFSTTNGGSTWTVGTDYYDCYAVKCSANGVYAIANAPSGGVWVTANSGGTWTKLLGDYYNGGIGNVYNVACSQTGQYMYAVGSTVVNGNWEWGIIKSADYGVTWSSFDFFDTGGQGIQGLTCSGDGKKVFFCSNYFVVGSSPTIAVVADGGTLSDSLSRNPDERYVVETGQLSASLTLGNKGTLLAKFGEFWNKVPQVPFFSDSITDDYLYATRVSANGQHLITGKYWAYPYISHDGGRTWAQIAGDLAAEIYPESCCVSEDGQVLLIPEYGTGLYVSTNGGTNWVLHDPATDLSKSNYYWRSAISANGAVMYAGVGYNGSLYKSTNYGATWSEADVSGVGDQKRHTNISVSSDGTVAYACCANNTTYVPEIWRTTNTGATWTKIFEGANPWTAAYVSCIPTRPGTVFGVFDDTVGYEIKKSTDYGDTWTTVHVISYDDASYMDTINCSGDGWYIVISGDSNIWGSEDGGDSWKSLVYFGPDSSYAQYEVVQWYPGNPQNYYFWVPEVSVSNTGTVFVSFDMMGPTVSYMGEQQTTNTNATSDDTLAFSLNVPTIEETATASDELDWYYPFIKEIFETGTLSDAISGHGQYERDIVETLTGSDVVYKIHEPDTLEESGTLSDDRDWIVTLAGLAVGQAVDLFPYQSFISQNVITGLAGPVYLITNYNRTALQVSLNIVRRIDPVLYAQRAELPEFNRVWFKGTRIYGSISPGDVNVPLPSVSTNIVYSHKIYLDGVDVTDKISACTITYSRDQFCGEVDVTWADESVYTSVDTSDLGTNYQKERLEVITSMTVNGETTTQSQGRFFIEKRSSSIAAGEFTFSSWGRNRPALLDSPYALPITKKWQDDTTALAIATEMTEAVGVSLNWDIADYEIKGSNFSVDGSLPIDIITTLAEAIGGVVYTERDGMLRVEYGYLV